MQRNQTTLQYLHSTCNMRFIPSPCVQIPTYIFSQTCPFFTSQFYLRSCKLCMIFFSLYFWSKLLAFSWWKLVDCMLFFYLCCHNKSCSISQHMTCVRLWEGDKKTPNFESQFFDSFSRQAWSFETSALLVNYLLGSDASVSSHARPCSQ